MAQPEMREGVIKGRVIYQDVYGNLISNISSDYLPENRRIEVRIEGQRISGLSRTFNDPNHGSDSKLIALIGSHGYLEVAVPNGNAAALLGITQAEVVQVVVVSS